METKTCTSCGEAKDVSLFYLRRGKPRPTCIECKKEADRSYRERTGYASDRQWEINILRKYGITAADYRRMELEQGCVCAVCGNPETVKQGDTVRRLAVDHDHTTGQVRGLLCGKCNTMVGLARENSDHLASAMMYLREHGSCRSEQA